MTSASQVKLQTFLRTFFCKVTLGAIEVSEVNAVITELGYKVAAKVIAEIIILVVIMQLLCSYM